MKKIALVLGTVLAVCALAGCGGGASSPAASGDTGSGQAAPEGKEQEEAAPAGEEYDTGHFKVTVPAGWKVFPQHQMFSDDKDALNPDSLQICKGGETEMDMFSRPLITIAYGGASNQLSPASKDFYDDVEDMEDIKTGSHTWTAYKCTSIGYKMMILFADEGEIQYQASLTYETTNGTIDVTDADVQEILASLEPTDPDDIAAMKQ